jgi:hypothetical protein
MKAKFCAVTMTMANQEQVDLVKRALIDLQREGVAIHLQTELMEMLRRKYGDGDDEVH